MNFQNMNRALRQSRRALLLSVMAVGILLVSNGFLALKIYSQSNQVVLVPTMVSDGMVARGTVDKGYIEALALDVVYAMYNSSPQTTQFGRDVLERLSSPFERSTILDTYDRISTDMMERKVSTTFRPRKIEHNFAKYEVVVDGVLSTYLETTEITREDRRILLRFVPQAGSVRLSFVGKLAKDTE